MSLSWAKSVVLRLREGVGELCLGTLDPQNFDAVSPDHVHQKHYEARSKALSRFGLASSVLAVKHQYARQHALVQHKC